MSYCIILKYPYQVTFIDWQIRDFLWSYLLVLFSEVVSSWSRVRAHVNIKLAHGLIDVYSYGLEMSNNNVDICHEQWVRPNQHETQLKWLLFLSTPCISFVPRPEIVTCTRYINMWIDVLRSYETVNCNRVVITVALRFILKHVARHGQSR
jgi:hypothetical protein